MVNTIDLRFVKDAEDSLVQLARRLEIPAVGLLNDDAHPGSFVRRFGQAGAAQLLDQQRIDFRRRRDVEESIASQTAVPVQFSQARPESAECLRVFVVPREVKQGGGEGSPLRVVHRTHFGDFARSFARGVAESVVGHGRAREAHDGVAGGQRRVSCQVVERGDQLAARQISRSAKNDDGARIGGQRGGRITGLDGFSDYGGLSGHGWLLMFSPRFSQHGRRTGLVRRQPLWP